MVLPFAKVVVVIAQLCVGGRGEHAAIHGLAVSPWVDPNIAYVHQRIREELHREGRPRPDYFLLYDQPQRAIQPVHNNMIISEIRTYRDGIGSIERPLTSAMEGYYADFMKAACNAFLEVVRHAAPPHLTAVPRAIEPAAPPIPDFTVEELDD